MPLPTTCRERRASICAMDGAWGAVNKVRVPPRRREPVAEARSGGKSLPQLVEELWELIRTYFKQETVEPVKGLGRYIAFGTIGMFLTGFGLVLLFLAGLRATQTE